MKFNNFKAMFATLAVSAGLVVSNGSLAQDLSHKNEQSNTSSQASVQNYVTLDPVKETYVQNVVKVYEEVLSIKENNYSEDSFQKLKDKIKAFEGMPVNNNFENFDEHQTLQMSLSIAKNLHKASQKMQVTEPLVLEVVSQTFTMLWPEYMEKSQLKDQAQRVMVENSLKAKIEQTAETTEMVAPHKDNLGNKISNLRTKSTVASNNKLGM